MTHRGRPRKDVGDRRVLAVRLPLDLYKRVHHRAVDEELRSSRRGDQGSHRVSETEEGMKVFGIKTGLALIKHEQTANKAIEAGAYDTAVGLLEAALDG